MKWKGKRRGFVVLRDGMARESREWDVNGDRGSRGIENREKVAVKRGGGRWKGSKCGLQEKIEGKKGKIGIKDLRGKEERVEVD